MRPVQASSYSAAQIRLALRGESTSSKSARPTRALQDLFDRRTNQLTHLQCCDFAGFRIQQRPVMFLSNPRLQTRKDVCIERLQPGCHLRWNEVQVQACNGRCPDYLWG